MKLNLKAIARSMGMALQKHSPEILTGIGIAGMITTTIDSFLNGKKGEKRNG